MSEDCLYCRFEKTEENCRGCWEGSNYRPKMTNADKIRAMTDEKLAFFLKNVQWDVAYLRGDSMEIKRQMDYNERVRLNHKREYPFPDEWLTWLEAEAEGEGK